jgi:putative membrane protein
MPERLEELMRLTVFKGSFSTDHWEGFMRVDLRFLSVSILATVLSLAVFGCERSGENVQAARETTNEDRPNKAVLIAADKDFLAKAEKDNIEEQNLGRVVVEKSQNKDVKDYAQMLVDDHTKALNDLVDLMNEKHVRQPKGLPDAKHEALSKLNGLSGAEFDREFIKMMVEDHQKAIAEFRQAQNTAQDEDVKKYAAHFLPTLEKHLKRAQELQRKLSSGAKTT